jgi:hypothetical protein
VTDPAPARPGHPRAASPGRPGPTGPARPVGAVIWRRGSRSGSSGGQCVEVAAARDRVAVRDSKDPAGPVLTFAPTAWRAFLASPPR